MNKKRIQTLIDFLVDLPKKKWDFNHTIHREAGCETVGCAAGWAGMIPKFRKLGFKTNKNSGIVKYKSRYDCMAIAKFFDIDPNTVDHIFYENNLYGVEFDKVTKSMVIKQLRKLLKGTF